MFNFFKKDDRLAAGNKSAPKKRKASRKRKDESVKHPAFITLVALTICGAFYAGYLYLNQEELQPPYLSPSSQRSNEFEADERENTRSFEQTTASYEETNPAFQEATSITNPPTEVVKSEGKIDTRLATPPVEPIVIANEQRNQEAQVTVTPQKKTTSQVVEKQVVQNEVAAAEPEVSPKRKEMRSSSVTTPTQYTVTGSKVYFHNQPDETTRRQAFINRWNKAVLKPLDDKNGFVYIVYKNHWGQTSKGWLPKHQLTPLNK